MCINVDILNKWESPPVSQVSKEIKEQLSKEVQTLRDEIKTARADLR